MKGLREHNKMRQLVEIGMVFSHRSLQSKRSIVGLMVISKWPKNGRNVAFGLYHYERTETRETSFSFVFCYTNNVKNCRLMHYDMTYKTLTK